MKPHLIAYIERRSNMLLDARTMQFVKFNSIERLNQWLRKYSILIVIDDFKVVEHHDELNYVLKFYFKELVAKQIKKDGKTSLEEQFDLLIRDAIE